MNKRQRKKHRVGEFQQLGFELRFATPETWSASTADASWDACINRVESLGLAIGGGTGVQWDVFVAPLKQRSTVTLTQQRALRDWLGAQPGVSDIQASELMDAWHPGKKVRSVPA